MSLRIIESFRLTQRVAIGTAFAASLGLVTLAAADQQVTALLRNGDRVTGLFDGYNNNQVYVDVSATDERKIPVGDVVLLDFVGGAQGLPETELSQARGDDHVLLLKSGNATKGRLVSVEGTDRDPTLLFRTSSGEERRVRFSEVGRLYLGRYPGAAPADSSAAAAPTTAVTTTTAGQTGSVTVNANQRWTSTGITVAKDQQVRFTSSGEVQLSPDANDAATTAGVAASDTTSPLSSSRVQCSAGSGIENRYPCIMSQPARSQSLSWSSVSTPSTSTFKSRPCASDTSARTIAPSRLRWRFSAWQPVLKHSRRKSRSV